MKPERSMARYLELASLCVVAAGWLGGCLESRRLPQQERTRCTACHGSPTRPGDDTTRAAPPVDLLGHSSPAFAGVGAHQIHLTAGKTHAVVACTECHLVPEDVFDPGHVDTPLPAEITFGTLARTGDRTPAYDSATRTCSDAYCHGAATPVWTAPRDSKEACGTCHGLPPLAPHTQRENCSTCHARVVDADRNIINPTLHVNGKVELTGEECGSCHGKLNAPAPPPDVSGNTQATSPGVGAHQAHLDPAPGYRPLGCDECHLVPVEVHDPGHLDAVNGGVTFSGVALTRDAAPRFDPDRLTCSGSWCHGPDSSPTSVSPVWNAPSEPLACDGCHGAPPPPPHLQVTNCSVCHGQVVDSARNIIDSNLHVDGKVEVVDAGCSSCHGSASSPAPPPDLSGSTQVTSPGVGAHQAHLDPPQGYRPLGCQECHLVPVSVDDPGHTDATDGGVTFSGVGTSQGATPRFDPDGLTCAGTWCHGPRSSTASASPVWNAPSGALDCTGCHGAPPPPPHPRATQCSACHGQVVDAARQIISSNLHVNGTVEVVGAGCSSCHGTAASPAPPPDLVGSSSVSSPGVGAHLAHLTPSGSHRPVDCQECHVVPASVDAPGHLDATNGGVTFSGVGTAQGATPRFDPSTLTCAGSWCHGPRDAAQSISPAWNSTAAPLDCTGCHGAPPAPPHPQVANCSLCHGQVVDAQRRIVGPMLHVNGSVEVVGTGCSSCHGSASSPAPPRDLSGSSQVSSPGVGAHQAHLNPTGGYRPLDCKECHLVPVRVEDPGHLDAVNGGVTFSGVGASQGASPRFDPSTLSCAGSWCHGPDRPAASLSPAWNSTAGPLTCNGCHGAPPALPHPQVNDCSRCHGAVVDAARQIVNANLHANGVVDVVTLTCASCHGSADSPAPPTDLSGSSQASSPGVGAHQVHLAGGGASRPVSCAECHLVPATIDAPGHIDQWRGATERFSGVAIAHGMIPSFDAAARTCVDTWCHGPVSGGSSVSPVWNSVAGRLGCNGCHGAPPLETHDPASTNCSNCHANVDASMQILDRTRHIDGTIDFR